MATVLVIGDCMLDQTTYGRVRRLSPESQNVLVVEEERVTYNLGGAANVAANAASLGAAVTLFGAVGDDDAGRRLAGLVRAEGIAHELAVVLWPTTCKHRIVTADGQLLRVDRERAAPNFVGESWGTGSYLYSRMEAALDETPVVCLVNYDKGYFCPVSLAALTQLLARYRDMILVDPGKDTDWLRFASPRAVFKVNLRQALAWVGGRLDLSAGELGGDSADFDAHARLPDDRYVALGEALGEAMRRVAAESRRPLCRCLAVTLGAGGILLVFPGRPPQLVAHDGAAAQVVDVTGAGDTVMAVLAWYLAKIGSSDEDLVGAARCANKAAAVAVARRGVHVATPEDVC